MPSPELHPIEVSLAAAWPPHAWRDVTVLLAVSGGADSVALLRAMTTLRTDGEGRLVAAHLNHQLRGDQSAADETFVIELCRQLGTPCEVGHARVDRLAAGSGDGLEAAARKARYEFLQQTATRLGARYVVTAHTADDQAETILHRIIRGTGVGGLAGMDRVRPLGPVTLIRPLLAVRRADLLAYLDELGQCYRSDSSNDNTRFTRNRIRHELLPYLARQFNAGVVDALLRLGTLASQVQTVVDSLVEDLAQRCVVLESPDTVQIDTTVLADEPCYIIRELLMAAWHKQSWPMQAMGFAQWDLLAEMITAEIPRKQMFPGGVLAEVRDGRLRLTHVGH